MSFDIRLILFELNSFSRGYHLFRKFVFRIVVYQLGLFEFVHWK